MNLTKRLIAANAIAVIIPLAITVIVALAYIFIFGKLFGSEINLENFQRLSEIRLELAGEQNNILQNPEIIEELAFQQDLQEKLAALNGDVIITKDDQTVFSSRNFSKIDIARFMESGKKNWGKDPVRLGDVSYSVQLVELPFPNGSEGNIIMLAPLGPTEANLFHFLLLLGLTFLLAFVVTTMFVSYQFSRTIVSPLHNLQKAAKEITKGNLDFQIAEEGDSEIEELCRDLELMRIRLKESIKIQLKYEDNRKMLVSSISHDLKTPVTTIKGYVEGILDGITSTPEKMNKYLKTIHLKAHQVDKMIDDLLLYAKLDVNQIPFHFEKTNAETFLRDALAENEHEFEMSGIELRLEVTLSDQADKTPFFNIDRDSLKRVLTNILDNSRKYMDKIPGLIRMILRQTTSSLIIEIRDNGSGISEIDLPHIFERFYRSDTSRSEIKGSGLGLAIAKQIIEGHGGRVWAVSHGSEGTSVMISLPKS